MAYEQIILAKSAGAVTITFNRPDKLNAFTFKMLEEVNQVLRTEASEVRAIVFRGSGRAFSAGDDLAGWAPRGIRWKRCARGIMR